MPDIALEMLIPTYPFHPITILHYVVILGAIWIVISAGEESTTFQTILCAMIAIMAVVNLYGIRVGLVGILIFVARAIMVMACLVTAGMAPNPKARTFAIILSLIALPILIVLFLPHQMGSLLIDPYYYR